MLRDLAVSYDMKIDEETIDEKATSMSSVMSKFANISIVDAFIHVCVVLKLIARKAYTWRDRLCES